jgi:hypothetical protein
MPRPQCVNKAVEPVSAKFFWLVLKLPGHSSLKYFTVCETSAFEMFLERSKQTEVKQFQIRAVESVWNNLKTDRLYYY